MGSKPLIFLIEETGLLEGWVGGMEYGAWMKREKAVKYMEAIASDKEADGAIDGFRWESDCLIAYRHSGDEQEDVYKLEVIHVPMNPEYNQEDELYEYGESE